MDKPKFVQVTWDDAWQDQENFATIHGIRQTHEPMVVKTRGWLLVDDAVGISLACEESTQDGHDVYRGRTLIPRAMIKAVDELKFTKPRIKKVKDECQTTQLSRVETDSSPS